MPTLSPTGRTSIQEDKLLPYCRNFVRRMRLAWETARLALQRAQLSEKAEFDSTHEIPRVPLKEGDSVMLYEPHLRQGTTKLTRGLAWTGPYRIEKAMGYNNYQLRDLRSNRMHSVVHIDRLRRYQGARQLPAEHFVVDQLMDVRRVSAAQARGPSRVEFLVRWRQYTQKDSTWEPMEALRESIADEVDAFIGNHSQHPAIRAWRNARGNSPSPRPSRTTSSSTATARPPRATSRESPRVRHLLDGLPSAASYKRGLWHYGVLHQRASGREYVRWMPERAFSQDELNSNHFLSLRQEHLSSLSVEEAALVALVQHDPHET